MDITIISRHQLKQMLEAAAEIGAHKALTQTGLLKPYLKKSEAFKLYGRANVERWIKEGLLKIRKDGIDSASYRLDRVELEAIAKTSNRITYMRTKERKPGN